MYAYTVYLGKLTHLEKSIMFIVDKHLIATDH